MKEVLDSPKDIALTFEKTGFEDSLNRYCRYPHERLMAWTMATVIALDNLAAVNNDELSINRAIDIFIQFGWRTSHFMW